jgi:5,6-dimethylbenzimidazole synthase
MFSNEERDAIYKVIYKRRDIRSFLSTPIPENKLHKILNAAHHAPSVGFMQPWNFILISSDEVKAKIAWAAEKERKALLSIIMGRKK